MSRPRTSPWTLLAIAAAAIAYQLPYFDRCMFLMDEGHILQFADILTKGGELYRDATMLPLPGAFYLLAAMFELFGPSILVARWIAVVEFALLCVFAFLILRRLAPAPAAWLGLALLCAYRIWAFPHWHMYSYSSLAQCLLAGALVALMRFLDSGDRRALAVAGFTTGLAISCKQDYGGAGLVAMNGVVVLAHRFASLRPARAAPPDAAPPRVWNALAWLNGSALVVGAVIAIHYLRVGLFGEMLQQTLINHLVGIATFEGYTSLPPLWPLFSQEPALRAVGGNATYTPGILFQVDWARVTGSWFYRETIGWDLAVKAYFYGPYALVALGGLRLWRARARAREVETARAYIGELALWALAAAMVLAFNKPVDYLHLVVLYWPLLLLLVVYTSAWLRGRPRLAWTLAALAAAPAVAAGAYTAQLTASLRSQHPVPLRTDRAGVYVEADEERVIGELAEYVAEHSQPGEAFAVLPYFPLVSFLAERPVPHRTTYTFWPIEYIEGRQQEIIEAIDKGSNDRLVYHFTQFPVFPRMSEYAPEVFAFLVDRYEIERVFASKTWRYMAAGLVRSQGPPRGRPLIDFDDPQLDVRVEAANGAAEAPADATRPDGGAMAEVALWPFRPVLALRPLSGGRRTVASLDLEVPPGAHLETAIGVHPDHWFHHPPSSVTFSMRAVAPGGTHELFTRTIRPQHDYRQRHWFEVNVPLDAFAGQRIRLELSATCERPEGELLAMGGWELPRLVAPADAPPSG